MIEKGNDILMKTHLWKINSEELNKTNLAKYSDFIKSSNLFFNDVQSMNEVERISKLIKKRIK